MQSIIFPHAQSIISGSVAMFISKFVLCDAVFKSCWG